MKNVIIISPNLLHYRLPFYEKLSYYNEDYQLTVFYGAKRKEDGRPAYTGKLRFNAIGFREIKFRLLAYKLVYNLGMFSKLKQINPDIVIIQGNTGNISYRRSIKWGKRKNKKIIIWACGFEPGRAKGLLLYLKNKLVASIFNKADYFLTYSNYASRYVRDLGIEQSIIKTCYNGLDIDIIKRSVRSTFIHLNSRIRSLMKRR